MSRPFSELRAKMSPERREKNKRAAESMLRSHNLTDVRRTRNLSKEDVASALDVDPTKIEEWETSSQVFLAWLRAYAEALGGDLRVRIDFPEGEVEIEHSPTPDEDSSISPERMTGAWTQSPTE